MAIVATTGTGHASGILMRGKTSVTLMVATSLVARAGSASGPFTSEGTPERGDTAQAPT